MLQAQADADRAARRAGVHITLLETPGELAEAEEVLRRVWGAGPTDSSIATPALMRAIEHAGGYVAGVRPLGGPGVAPVPGGSPASAGRGAAASPGPGPRSEILPGAPSGPLVGVCIGFCAAPGDLSLHSHVAGLLAGSVGRGAGRALKLHQRAWALEHGLTSITWTYDPLVSRNAHFNLQRLGARLEEYLVDFYGPLADGVNIAEPSDRALVRWVLEDRRVGLLARGEDGSPGVPGTGGGTVGRSADSWGGDGPRRSPRRIDEGGPELSVLLTEGVDGAPRSGATTAEALLDGGPGRALVAAPGDIEGLRRRDPDAAQHWRLALRGAILPLLEYGWEVAGFARGRGYLIEGDR
ncbi:MAG: hypothetical protein ACTJGR_03600 [Pauljensenia sp.]